MKEQMKLLSEAQAFSPCMRVGGELWWIENVNVHVGIVEKIEEGLNQVTVHTAKGSVVLRADENLIMV